MRVLLSIRGSARDANPSDVALRKAQTTPWASMASATLTKPAMLAPSM